MKIDRDVLGCLRVAEGPAGVSGATTDHCVECGAEVWIAPSSLGLIAKHKLEIVCVQCIPPADHHIRIELSDEQKQELRNAMDTNAEHEDPRQDMVMKIMRDPEWALKVITTTVAVVSMMSKVESERLARDAEEVPEPVLRAAWESISMVLALAVAGKEMIDEAIQEMVARREAEE